MFKIRKWDAFVALVANQFVLSFQVNFKIRTHLDVNVDPYNILNISTCNLAKCIQRQCTFHLEKHREVKKTILLKMPMITFR